MNTANFVTLVEKQFRFLALGVVAATALAFTASARANLLTNGSFEQGPGANPSNSGTTQTFGNGDTSLPGWTVLTTTQISWDSNGAFGVPVGAGAGDYYLDVTGNNDTTNGQYTVGSNTYYTSGGVYQTFATTAGDTYDVSYLLGTDSFYNGNSTPGLEAFVGTSAPSSYSSLTLGSPTSETGLASGHPQSRGVWTDEGFDFTATGSSTTLTLIGYSSVPIGSNQYIGLDDVSVTDLGNRNNSVPDAGSSAILLMLGLATLAVSRKFRAGAVGA
jgi:hypothetical protein